jgi:hypothetical protein
VDRGIALPFRDLGARRGEWSASRPGRFTPGKDPVPIVQEVGWASGPVWTGAKNLAPHQDYFCMLVFFSYLVLYCSGIGLFNVLFVSYFVVLGL